MTSKVSVVDYCVFGASLVVPIGESYLFFYFTKKFSNIFSAIALYYACIKKQKTTNSVFLGDRTLSALPISFSLAVSYLSAVTITGTCVIKYYFGDLNARMGIVFLLFSGIPGEIAYHGWLFPWTWLLASTFSLFIVGNLFIPIFYKMRLTSVYEVGFHRENENISFPNN